ncbi:hypothetical protein KEM48_007173 [Puccinia striiformis f. sp. tritici PST-130]|nr:hypothetical protein Pst134EB_010256 [Puccinia striiformis f. sp. tritici]KAI9622556.1 hypothetical protein KEM48_007173 [Puccinia striiformis f. sp. tritici PST-130]
MPNRLVEIIIIFGTTVLHSSPYLCNPSPGRTEEMYYLPQFDDPFSNIAETTAGWQDFMDDQLLTQPPTAESHVPQSSSYAPDHVGHWFNDHQLGEFIDSIPSDQWGTTHSQAIDHQLPSRNCLPDLNSPTPNNQDLRTVNRKTNEKTVTPPIPPLENRKKKKSVRLLEDVYKSTSHPISPTTDHEALFTATIRSNEEIVNPPEPPVEKRKRRYAPVVKALQLSQRPKQIKSRSFDLSNEKLKIFGWMSTLKYSPKHKHESLVSLWNTSEAREFWKRFDDVNQALPALLNILVDSGELSRHHAVYRTKRLVREISARHADLLTAFVPPQDGPIPLKSEASRVAIREQQEVLNWFLDQLEIHHELSGAVDAESARASHHLSPLQSSIISYLGLDPDRLENSSARWETRFPEKRSAAAQPVNLHQAEKTRLAINILGNYYKSTNPEKWQQVFVDDQWFINLFLSLKAADYHCNIKKSQAKYQEGASLGIFPWKNQPDFSSSIDGQSKLMSILSVLASVRVSSINMHFLPIEPRPNPPIP